MRIDLLAIGSQGDVQPYVALGLGLQKSGHRVRVVTLGGFEELVRARGLDHLVIGDNPKDIATTAAGRKWVENRASPAGFFRGFIRVAASLIEEGIRSYWENCRQVELLISSPMGLLVGTHIGERLGIPLIVAQLAPPILPTRYGWDGRVTLGTRTERAWTVFLDATFRLLIQSKLRAVTNAARAKVLALPPLRLLKPANNGRRLPLLGAYSLAVAPKPPDWGEWVHVTGYWFLEDLPGWLPPPALVEFLESGPPPVFIGFGSTPFPQPEDATQMVVRAVARAGCRGVLLAGGSGLSTGRLSDEVFSVDSVPHGWLFPQVSAAVHHGGAGVTGAALRAGLPSVVVPVFADQPFWGSRVFELGAGPRPIPAQRLTEDNLTKAIQATSGSEMRRRAAALGEKIRREDGIARAIEIIDKNIATGVFNPIGYRHAS